MSDLNFLNSEKYITGKILEINGIVELLSSKERASQVGLEITKVKDYKFSSKSSVMLSILVDEGGFLIIRFTCGKENFYFESYLERYDLANSERFQKIAEKCRAIHEFQFNLESKLNFFIEYVNSSEDLQLVLEGKRMFNIVCDFGGMK